MVHNLPGSALYRLWLTSDGVAGLLASDWCSAASAPFAAGAGVLYVGIMRRVTRAQRPHGGLAGVFA